MSNDDDLFLIFKCIWALAFIIEAIFVSFKLLGWLTWSWIWVLCPIWGVLSLLLLGVTTILVVIVIRRMSA